MDIDLYSEMVEYRRHIHQNPELSFCEAATSSYIKQILHAEGVRIEEFGIHHSFAAIVEGGEPGKTWGMRAELDALPIDESTGLEYSSAIPGVMHACGHDMHMAIAIGVTKSLQRKRNKLKGRFVAIFESGEEVLPGGAKAIIQSKLFKSLNPNAMIGVHVLPELEVGKVGLCPGKYMASGDEVYITVKGRGGHAALPNLLVDPVVCSAEIILSLQQLVSRNAPTLIPTVLSFGRVEAAGATNIIPDEVSIAGTFRTMDEAWRMEAHRLIERIAKGIATSHGAKCEVEIRKGYPMLFSNPNLTETVKRISLDIFGSNNVVDLEPRMTTDDFAYFSSLVPAVFFRVGTGFPNADNPQLHRANFNPSEEAMSIAFSLLTKVFQTLMQ